MNGLDLFSGIGGISYGLRKYIRPIAYCEIEPYCQAVLLSRMADESICDAPIWDDITTLSGLPFDGSVDIIYGGFPCQDISVAGHGKGLEGERSGLFFEIVRLAKEIKPRFIFLENVPAITSRGGLRVVREIAEMGYDCRWCVISAASVGAMHKRDRWFLLAKSRCERLQERAEEIQSERKKSKHEDANEFCWGKTESELDRKANGIQCQMDRIRALGNAVVPQQTKKAFEMLMGIK
jgi:DNA (cytosine-5)-methyltransferase 1